MGDPVEQVGQGGVVLEHGQATGQPAVRIGQGGGQTGHQVPVGLGVHDFHGHVVGFRRLPVLEGAFRVAGRAAENLRQSRPSTSTSSNPIKDRALWLNEVIRRSKSMVKAPILS